MEDKKFTKKFIIADAINASNDQPRLETKQEVEDYIYLNWGHRLDEIDASVSEIVDQVWDRLDR